MVTAKRLDFLENDLERAAHLLKQLAAKATGQGGDEEHYHLLRSHFVGQPILKALLPDFVRTNRNLGEFWQFIQPSFVHYGERRTFLKESFEPLFDFLEGGATAPNQDGVTDGLARFDAPAVQEAWTKALERKATDPEGAITAARALLETVCKHILDDAGVEYEEHKIELPALYKLTAKALKLAPDQHTESIFKQILGGCTSIITGLGALRNRVGDAHGSGKRAIKPAPRHAGLAVNLSGSVALFLIETWEARKNEAEPKDS